MAKLLSGSRIYGNLRIDTNVSVLGSNVSTSTTTGAIVVTGGVGVGGNLNILNTGDVSANIGALFNGNISTNANLGAYQTFANANVVAIQANIGAFYNYANTKIGTNTNSNLVVVATTTSTSTTTGALVVAGGAGVSGNLYVGSTADQSILLNAYPEWSSNAVRQTPRWTTSTTTPVSSILGDMWYDSSTDILYEYINDGASSIWVDVSSAFSNNFVVMTGVTVKATGNAQAFNTTTGDLQVAGGASINTGNLYIGGSGGRSITATGNAVITGSSSTSTVTGALVVTGGVGISGTLFNGGNIVAASGTTSTSTTTGALVVVGGAGIGGTLQVGSVQTSYGNIIAAAGTVSTSTTTGAIVVVGGIGISGALRNGGVHVSAGNIVADSGTASTSSTTGALVVSGGVGISGNITTAGWIIPTSNISQNIGTSNQWWGTFYGVSTQARYADLAENYLADNDYEAGTVTSFGGEKEITISQVSHDAHVAGVISTNPAHLMNNQLQGPTVVPLALQGRVPCFVQGPVNKGDLLVSSDNPGVACKLDKHKFTHGCLIGKSLEQIDDSSVRKIEIMVGRY